jgi:hypothetical protein
VASDHIGAAFLLYRLNQSVTEESTMRLLFGIILGCALTVGGAYFVDHMASRANDRTMVNWDVVAKNVDEIATMARDGWRRITG